MHDVYVEVRPGQELVQVEVILVTSDAWHFTIKVDETAPTRIIPRNNIKIAERRKGGTAVLVMKESLAIRHSLV